MQLAMYIAFCLWQLQFFKHGIWSADGCAASQSDAMFENPNQVARISM